MWVRIVLVIAFLVSLTGWADNESADTGAACQKVSTYERAPGEPAGHEETSRFAKKVLLRGGSGFGGIDDGSDLNHEPASFDTIANEAFELLTKGNKLYRNGHAEDALALWEQVICKYRNAPAWYMATLNSGRVLQRAHQYRAAIKKLTPLLADESYAELGKAQTLAGEAHYALGDQPGNARPIVLTPLENYLHGGNTDWHLACEMISECYEALGNVELAQYYAILARDMFPCRGLCWSGSETKLELLLERLEIPEKVLSFDEIAN